MKTVTPYLMFNGQAEEAFDFYKSVFGGKMAVTRYSDMGEDPNNPMSETDKNLIVNIVLELNGPEQIIMASDVPPFMPQTKAGDNFLVSIETDSAEEVGKLYEALRDGDPLMEMQATEWAEKFAMVRDKFGVQWILNYTGNKAVGA